MQSQSNWTVLRVVALTKSLYPTILTFNDPEKVALGNIVGKGENAGDQHSPLPTIFSTLPPKNFIFLVAFILLSANALNLNKSKILLFGKGLSSQKGFQPTALLLPNFEPYFHLI